jgi:ABC-type phosphate transport system substrate-binding protein
MPAGPKGRQQEETTMLKTISAALVAVSVLAAPALAGAPGKTAQAPANKTTQAPVNKATQAPIIKAEGKSKTLNANAKMGSHYKHYRHHRHHKHIGLHKTHAKHIAVKHVTPAAKRS